MKKEYFAPSLNVEKISVDIITTSQYEIELVGGKWYARITDCQWKDMETGKQWMDQGYGYTCI